VFFLVCASTQPDSGRQQNLPKSEQTQQQQEKSENLQIDLTRTLVQINGEPVKMKDFIPLVKAKLKSKTRPEDKVVIVKSKKDVPYHHWIAVTTRIEEAGGIVTLQIEEEQQQIVP
jgi:biopolymer transport protein ExbD